MATPKPRPETCMECGGEIDYIVDPCFHGTPGQIIFGPTNWILNPNHVCQDPPDTKAIEAAKEMALSQLARRWPSAVNPVIERE